MVITARLSLLAVPLLAASVGCAGSTPSRQVAQSPTPSLAASPPESSATQIAVGGSPCGLAAVRDAVWVSDLSGQAVVEINASTRAPGRRIPMPGDPCWITGDGTSLWVGLTSTGDVQRLETTTGRVDPPVHIGTAPADARVAIGFGSVWATAASDGELVRLDARTGRIQSRIADDDDPRSLLVTSDVVWVAHERPQTLTAVDPRQNKVVRRLHVPKVTSLVGRSAAGLWVATGVVTEPSSEVLLLNPATGAVLKRYPVGGNPQPGLFVGADVWVPNHLESSISVITSRGPVRTEPTGRYPSSLLLVDGAVWVAEFGDGTVSVHSVALHD